MLEGDFGGLLCQIRFEFCNEQRTSHFLNSKPCRKSIGLLELMHHSASDCDGCSTCSRVCPSSRPFDPMPKDADHDSVHNLCVANHQIHDPSLTAFGEEQCRQLAQSFPKHESVDLLVCSPLRRTIYTTLLAFQKAIERSGSVIALPEAQEVVDIPCDTGSDLSVLQREMADKPVDLSRVMDGWNTKTGRWAPTATAVARRAKEARQWLKARPEKEIVLVTHGGFVHYFTEDWSGYVESRG